MLHLEKLDIKDNCIMTSFFGIHNHFHKQCPSYVTDEQEHICLRTQMSCLNGGLLRTTNALTMK